MIRDFYDNHKFDITELEFREIEPILEMNNIDNLLYLDKDNMTNEKEIMKFEEFENLFFNKNEKKGNFRLFGKFNY